MINIDNKVNIHFPLKLVPRKEQVECLNFVKNSINNGKKYILLNAPTGVGKSYFANMFMNWYKNSINEEANFDILTNSLILMSQYVKENLFIKNFKGKANYFCDKFDTDCEKGLEICQALKQSCDHCPYDIAKKQWIAAEAGLTNFHLFNTLALYARPLLEKRIASVLIIDEAHSFEEVFCDFISTTSSAKSLKKYGFDLKAIEDYDEKFKRIKGIGQYVGFVENQFLPDLENLIIRLSEKISNDKTKKLREEISRHLNHCIIQKQKFVNLVKEYKLKKENWVLDITNNEKDKMYSGIMLEAKPIWGNNYLKEVVWDRYDHIVFMSGTMLDRELFSYINGLDVKRTDYFEMDSPFHINRRPVFYIKVGKMTWEQKAETFKSQIPIIKKIMARNKDKKGIIHCGNYEFASWIQEHIQDKRFIFHDTENRDEKLEEHINSISPTVIVSPSMISGVDLKDDLSRFQIILKIPYPFLGSNKVKQRQNTNSHWYSWKTVMDFIQMYGRSVRSVDDWAETYVLDSSLSDLLKYNGQMIPRYISDAIKLLK